MELKLYFTSQEMKDYLRLKNYIVETISSWQPLNEYHGKTSYIKVQLDITYLEGQRPTKSELEKEERYIRMNWGVENIFVQEIKTRFLKG